jgi:ABC-type multidrug transport system fused ATPase/permease subunit
MSLLGTFNHSVTTEATSESVSVAREIQHHDPAQSISSEDTALEKTEVGNEDVIEAEVTRLARRLTRESTRWTDGENTFLEVTEGSTLDPHSENFRARNWMKNLLAITSRDPERYPGRQAGVSFRNLSVHGFGSPTDYQKDVFNSVLQVGALARMITGTGKQKIQILRDFDGIVKSGEMLVVLGRPGSGCSTFLKTLAGEMNGIHKDEKTRMNYQGISD